MLISKFHNWGTSLLNQTPNTINIISRMNRDAFYFCNCKIEILGDISLPRWATYSDSLTILRIKIDKIDKYECFRHGSFHTKISFPSFSSWWQCSKKELEIQEDQFDTIFRVTNWYLGCSFVWISDHLWSSLRILEKFSKSSITIRVKIPLGWSWI